MVYLTRPVTSKKSPQHHTYPYFVINNIYEGFGPLGIEEYTAFHAEAVA